MKVPPRSMENRNLCSSPVAELGEAAAAEEDDEAACAMSVSDIVDGFEVCGAGFRGESSEIHCERICSVLCTAGLSTGRSELRSPFLQAAYAHPVCPSGWAPSSSRRSAARAVLTCAGSGCLVLCSSVASLFAARCRSPACCSFARADLLLLLWPRLACPALGPSLPVAATGGPKGSQASMLHASRMLTAVAAAVVTSGRSLSCSLRVSCLLRRRRVALRAERSGGYVATIERGRSASLSSHDSDMTAATVSSRLAQSGCCPRVVSSAAIRSRR